MKKSSLESDYKHFEEYISSLRLKPKPRVRKIRNAAAAFAAAAVLIGGCTTNMGEIEKRINEATSAATQNFEQYKAGASKAFEDFKSNVNNRFETVNQKFRGYYTKAETDASRRVLESRMAAMESGLKLARTQIEGLERTVAAQQQNIQPSAMPRTAVSQYPLDPNEDHIWYRVSNGDHYLVLRPVISAKDAPSVTLRAILKNGTPIANILPNHPIEIRLTREEYQRLGSNPVSRFEVQRDSTISAVDYSWKSVKTYVNQHAAYSPSTGYAMPRPLMQQDIGGIPARNDFLARPKVGR